MRYPSTKWDLHIVLSDSRYHTLPWWRRLPHLCRWVCYGYLRRHVLVRHAFYQPDVSALIGEVWTLCGVCGRLLGKRREQPVDATRFGVADPPEAWGGGQSMDERW
jgi:hypothetical protein